METKTSSSRMQSLLALYDMHTTFFAKAIDSISDEDAHKRLDTKANHIAWLTGTLVNQRFTIAKDTGTELQQTGEELFKDNQGIKDGVTYPSLEQYKKDWDIISPIARKALVNVTDESLDGVIDMGGMKMTLYELSTFTIYREANCIGQIALWRRLLGYPALKYD